MTALKIQRNGVISLPANWRKSLGLKDGDFLNAELEDRRIVLKPAMLIDAEDAWFYSKEWQEKEREADRDLAEGRAEGPFETMEKMIEALKKKRAK